MTDPHTLPSENIFGIGKKMHLELEKLTIVDHGSVIAMINAMAQRRELAEKLERQQAQHAEAKRQQDANTAAMADAMAAHERRRMAEEQQLAEKTAKDAGIVLVGG